jgi:hypothetical protein
VPPRWFAKSWREGVGCGGRPVQTGAAVLVGPAIAATVWARFDGSMVRRREGREGVRQSQIRYAELALDDRQRDPFVRHLDLRDRHTSQR